MSTWEMLQSNIAGKCVAIKAVGEERKHENNVTIIFKKLGLKKNESKQLQIQKIVKIRAQIYEIYKIYKTIKKVNICVFLKFLK